MKVYRVQDEDGRGPFKPGFSRMWVEDRPDHDNLIPWMGQFDHIDLSISPGTWFGCGCLTIEQLRRWFTPTEYAKLQSLGYKAVSMEGRIIASSGIQCIFDRPCRLCDDVQEIELYLPTLERAEK